MQADLAGPEGVDRLYAAAKGRTVDLLLANAGRGWAAPSSIRTRNLAARGRHQRHRDADACAKGRERHAAGGGGAILITGSIAGFMPGTYQAVYNGTKAFLDSFSFALRHEQKIPA